MTPDTYEKALLANAAYRLAFMDNVDELIAICCVIRNHMNPRFGPSQYKSYSEALEDFFCIYPLRPNPAINNPVLVSKTGILGVIESIYDGRYTDITASRNNPLGAKYFARVQSLSQDDWRFRDIVSHPEAHPLIGTFGSQCFYE